MIWTLFENIGRLFIKEPKPQHPVQPEPSPVSQVANPKLLAELKSADGWDHRYVCTDCKQHHDIMRWRYPCHNCGGYISPHQQIYKWIKNLSEWLTRDQVREMIKKLEKGEPF